MSTVIFAPEDSITCDAAGPLGMNDIGRHDCRVDNVKDLRLVHGLPPMECFKIPRDDAPIDQSQDAQISNWYGDLAKIGQPAYLGDVYRKVAVRYVFMAEELLRRPEQGRPEVVTTPLDDGERLFHPSCFPAASAPMVSSTPASGPATKRPSGPD